MPKVKTRKSKVSVEETQAKKSPWTNLVDFLRRVNAARRSEILLYNKRLSLLSRIAKTINSEAKINKILRLILKGAVNLTNSNAGVIFFRRGKKLKAVESYGIKVVAQDLIIRPWRGIVGHVLKSKKSYLCNNTDHDKYFVAWGSAKQAHSELAIPIIINRQVVGVLIVSSRDYDKYQKIDEMVLKDLGENATIAIKNARESQILEEKVRWALASRMQFVADVSHELRTPLTVIQGNIELLKRSKNRIPKRDQEAMEDVIVETKNVANKLENLINLIHEGSRPNRIEISQFELSQLIDEVAEMARRLAKEKRIEVINKNNTQIKFFGDREKIKEMMLNLAANAVKYNQYRGRVMLTTQIKRNKIEIEVADTGIGIAKPDLPFIFDRFYRAQDIERYKKKGGSGIGLSVSRWIARAHGGEIKVESKVGVGTKFIVILPFSG